MSLSDIEKWRERLPMMNADQLRQVGYSWFEVLGKTPQWDWQYRQAISGLLAEIDERRAIFANTATMSPAG